METIHCKGCGRELAVPENARTCKCRYCGLLQTFSDAGREAVYRDAADVASHASTQAEYWRAAGLFRLADGWKDAEKRADDCYAKAESVRIEAACEEADALMAEGSIESLRKAVGVLRTVRGARDVEEPLADCIRRVEEADEAAAVKRREELIAEHEAAVAAIREARRKKRGRNILIGAAAAVVVLAATMAVLRVTAYRHTFSWMRKAQVGDVVYLGSWEQDGRSGNGGEDIAWIVLEREGDRLYLVSKITCVSKFYNDGGGSATWETSTLRQWLNGEFYDTAFSEKEKALIQETDVPAEQEKTSRIEQGNDTRDKVFLLSKGEAERYFTEDTERKCRTSRAAEGSEILTSDLYCWWWTRTVGQHDGNAFCVHPRGNVIPGGTALDLPYVGVRPAMWIDLGDSDR